MAEIRITSQGVGGKTKRSTKSLPRGKGILSPTVRDDRMKPYHCRRAREASPRAKLVRRRTTSERASQRDNHSMGYPTESWNPPPISRRKRTSSHRASERENHSMGHLESPNQIGEETNEMARTRHPTCADRFPGARKSALPRCQRPRCHAFSGCACDPSAFPAAPTMLELERVPGPRSAVSGFPAPGNPLRSPAPGAP